MATGLISVAPPLAGVFRLARGLDPFAPPPWELALEDGTFGNRFDDPGAAVGKPPEERFRFISYATARDAQNCYQDAPGCARP
jgi:hypothetical protein